MQKNRKSKKNVLLNDIPNLKEKELLIANYFCGKTRKNLTPDEVFDMWCNWFKKDFRVNNQPTFFMKNGKLEYRTKIKNKDKTVLKQYNIKFQMIYDWIKRAIDISGDNKAYFRKQLDTERTHRFTKVLALAKPMGFYVVLSKKNLYSNKLGDFRLLKNEKTFVSGDCDKVISYLKNYKKEKDNLS